MNLQAKNIGQDTWSATTGRLETVTFGSEVANYGFATNSDLVGTVTSSHSGGSTTLTRNLAFDALNRIATIANTLTTSSTSASTITYSYNDRNQRTSAQEADGRVWVYGYDSDPGQTGATFSSGQVISSNKFLTATASTPMLGYAFGWAYDGTGGIDNRISSTANTRTASYSTNNRNQYTQRDVPAAIDVRGAASTAALVLVNTTTASRTGADFYAALTATNSEGAYASIMNIAAATVSATVTVQTATRSYFVAETPETFTYDLDGNLTEDGRWDYTYDAENRMISAQTRADVGALYPALKQQLAFAYDSQNRRVSKTVANWNFSTSTFSTASQTLFVYDGWNLVAELDGMNYSAPLADPTVSGPAANPAGDGMSNLLKYAFGLDPTQSDATAGQPQVGTTHGSLTIAFIQRTDISDINYVVEVSTDLVTWTSGPTITQQISATPLDATRHLVTVQDLTPMASAPARFIRLRVVQP